MDFSSTVASQLYTGAILPESIVILTLIVVLVGDLIVGRARSGWIPYAAIAGLLGSVFALYLGWDNPHPVAFLGAFNSDNLSILFRGIIVLSTAFTIMMSVRYVERSGTALSEFICILLTATLGDVPLWGE